MLAGASSGRIDQAIQMLVETEEIDDDLLIFMDYLVEKERARSRGGQYSPLYSAQSSSAASSATLDVLLMVQRRLRAETITSKDDFVRILHTLLSLPSTMAPQQRVEKIRELVKSIEQLRNFEDFVQNGIDYIKQNGMRAKEPGRGGNKSSSKDSGRDAQEDAKAAGNAKGDREGREYMSMGEDMDLREVELAPTVLEQMKDLLIDIRSITKSLYAGGVGETVFEMESTRSVPTRNEQ